MKRITRRLTTSMRGLVARATGSFRDGRLLATVVALMIAVVSTPSSAQGQQPRVVVPDSVRVTAARGEPVRIIVGLRLDTYQPEGLLGSTAAASQRLAIQDVASRVLGRLSSVTSSRVFDFIPYFAAEVDANTLLQLEADPDVSSIEEDRQASPSLAESVPLVGGSTAWSSGYSGAGWTVAILDTGVEQNHSFLNGKTVAEGCYSNSGIAGANSLCPGGVGSTNATGSGASCAMSDCFHGTHVAGIAAGRGGTFSGVAKDATIMSFQVYSYVTGITTCFPSSSCIRANLSDIIAAMNRVYALRGSFNIAAVNLSLIFATYSSQADCEAGYASLKAAIDTLRSANIATVAAAGNGGLSGAMGAPACISTAISVGATTKSDVVSSTSNAAPYLNVLAPGVSITSSLTGNTFGALSGTSMAAPHVAGAWAVLRQRNPTAAVTTVLNALRSTGNPVTDTRSGLVFPRIRVDAALTALSSPLLTIDTPVTGASTFPPFVVNGWAIDRNALNGSGIDAVHLYAYPSAGGSPIFLGTASYGGPRPDIGAAFGGQFTNSAFSLTVRSLTAGSYSIRAFGHSTVTGTFNITSSVPMTVTAPVPSPAMAVDVPLSNSTATRTFTISGWAIDRAAPSGTGVDGVHVWAFPSGGGSPTFLGAAAYGVLRPDVGALFGSQFANTGYFLQADLAPGAYTINVYLHSTVSGTFVAVRSVPNVTVAAPQPNPILTIDAPTAGVSRTPPFTISGWAVDTGAASGTGMDTVHVWAFPTSGASPVLVGAATYGLARPDVATALGNSRFTNSGYSLTVTTANLPVAETYDFYVFAHSTVTGTFNIVRAVRVTVTNGVPTQPSVVRTSGRQLLLEFRRPDGTLAPAAPYVIRGVNWSPASRTTNTSSRDPNNVVIRRPEFGTWYQTDIPLLKAMNVNTVRLFIDPGVPGDPNVTVPGLAVLDELYRNGIMVIMTVDNGNNSVDRIQPVIDSYKNHPAILMWSLGSEWNINLFWKEGTTLDGAAAAIESAARLVKSFDTQHPVVSSYGNIDEKPNDIERYVTQVCPTVDVWSFNEYTGPGFSRLFDKWSFISGKPMFLAEFGIDAFNSTVRQEAQFTQSQYMGRLWDEIARNLSATDPTKVALGGAVMEFNDEWWKSGSPFQQDEGGWSPIAFPDKYASEDWWGIVTIDRVARGAYYILKTRFEPSYQPPSANRLVTFQSESTEAYPYWGRFWENGAPMYQGRGAIDNGGRGFNIAAIDPATGRLRNPIQHFDTWLDHNNHTSTNLNAMVSYLDSVPVGTLLLMTAVDEAGLNDWSSCAILPDQPVNTLINRLEALGSRSIRQMCYSDNWVMMAIKGQGAALGESLGHGVDAAVTASIQLP